LEKINSQIIQLILCDAEKSCFGFLKTTTTICQKQILHLLANLNK